MSAAPTHSSEVDALVRQLRDGDPSVRDQLVAHACDRLRRLVRWHLRGFPAVRRWEETGDVLQSVLVRLCRALGHVRPNDVREFYALSGALIRRELIDLKRHHYGPEGAGARHATRRPVASGDTSADGAAHEPIDARDPAAVAAVLELHEHVEALPAELAEVVNLIWYQGLSHEEAAVVLGTSAKTVSRRWRDARLQLRRWLRDDLRRG